VSLDLAARLRTFYASSPQRYHPIATLQISHSAMSRAYHLWREPYFADVTLETWQVVQMQPANIEIKLAGSATNLDQLFEIRLDLTDANDDFRDEMDRVPIDTRELVVIVYREYLSDNLGDPQVIGRLQVESVSYDIGAAKILASSPRLNVSRTGELYVPAEIPMLRGFS